MSDENVPGGALDAMVEFGRDLSTWATTDATLDELADLKVRWRDTMRELSFVGDAIDAALWDAMPDNEVSVAGVGSFKRDYGARRQGWQHEYLWKLVERLAQERIVDSETGETRSAGEAVAEALAVAKELQQPAYWRKTALEKYGIDPDEYCETKWGRRTVRIMQANEPKEKTDDG